MGERVATNPETLDRIPLQDIIVGDVVAITTGEGAEAWQYELTVDDTTTQWPKGTLRTTRPDGQTLGPIAFAIHGCGNWTTREQNPVQTQLGTAFTSYFDSLYLGGFLVGHFEGQEERAVFDQPRQEVSHLTINRHGHRENTRRRRP
jgi:hypothetical protein